MRSHGFTLTELMITMTLASIVLTVGVPSFQEVIRSNRVVTETNDILTALNLARSEAVKRGQRVSLCASNDQTGCTGENDWANGWIVFLDTADKDTDSPVVGEVLRVWETLPGNAQVSGPESIRYRPAGDVIDPSRLDYALGTGDHQKTRLLCIGHMGRPILEKELDKCDWE